MVLSIRCMTNGCISIDEVIVGYEETFDTWLLRLHILPLQSVFDSEMLSIVVCITATCYQDELGMRNSTVLSDLSVFVLLWRRSINC
jgi:hypothetical protein